MADVSSVRRSGRRTVRPVEFWNFEKPDSKSEKIIYNLGDLSKCSIYSTMSTKYLHGTINKSAKNCIFVDKVSVNNVNETESVDGRSKIVKGKGKLPYAPKDASPGNSKEKTNEANEKERFNNNVNETESVDGRSKIVKGKGKLPYAPKDASPDNSKENTNEVNEKERFNNIEKHLANSTIFKVPKGRYKRKAIEEVNVQDSAEGEQMENDTADQQQNFSSFSHKVMSESVTSRRSGRIRTKPLEFWNFERVEVKPLENGELSIVHHKQVLPPPINRKGKEKEKAAATPHPSVSPARTKCKKHALQKLSQASSPSKRKLSPPFCSSTNKEVHFEDEQPSKRKTLDGEQDSTVTPTVQVTKLSDLNFCQCAEEDYKCYLARSYQDAERDIYAGFVFLEHGKVIWNTTRETNLYVLEGCGTLLMVDDTAEGVALHLKDAFQTTITNGKKISITKDGRCKMLKLFIVLGSSSGTSSSVCQDDAISETQVKQVIVS